MNAGVDEQAPDNDPEEDEEQFIMNSLTSPDISQGDDNGGGNEVFYGQMRTVK